MSSLVTKVRFQTEFNSKAEESVWLVGDTSPLGSWNINFAIPLHTSPSEHPNWSCTLEIPSNQHITYKYFLRTVKKNMNSFLWEDGENRGMNITGMEMIINDGKFRLEDTVPSPSVFIDEGWLTTEIQVNWRLGIMDPEASGSMLQPVRLINQDWTATQMEIEHPRNSSMGNLIVNLPLQDSLSSYNFFADKVENFYLKLKISIHDGIGTNFIGKAIFIGDDFKEHRGISKKPILNSELEVIGYFQSCYQVVLPFIHPKNSVSSLWESFKKTPLSADEDARCGHRGCGSNKTHTVISENTILSFLTAAQYGADYIEFDVQITSDNIPVIFHDYEVPVGPLKVPVCQLSYRQFVDLTPKNSRPEQKKLKKLCKSQSLDHLHGVDNVDKDLLTHPVQDSLCSLEEVFRRVPMEAGFMIELKYPSELLRKERRILYLERNEFVDIILKVVFESAHHRRIIFLTFDPDVALLLRAKQKCYPVLFLTSIGDIDPDFDHFDHRCLNFDNAIRFAELAHLRGIVASTATFFKEKDVLGKAKAKGLLFGTYGSENMNEDIAKMQKKMGVDAVIVDNILRINKKLQKKEGISNVVMADNILYMKMAETRLSSTTQN